MNKNSCFNGDCYNCSKCIELHASKDDFGREMLKIVNDHINRQSDDQWWQHQTHNILKECLNDQKSFDLMLKTQPKELQ